MNAITKAIIAAGIIDSVVTLECRAPSTYMFEAEQTLPVKKGKQRKGDEPVSLLTDPITDSKFVRQFVNLAYTGLVGAILREAGSDKPLFDASTEYNSEDDAGATHKAADRDLNDDKPMTLSQAVRNAAVVWRVAEHYSRIEGNEWLRNISKLSLVRDSNGNMQAIRTTEEIIRPFDEWLVVEIERNADDSQWGMSCQFARQLSHDEFPLIGIDQARLEFSIWLDEIPFNRDNLSLTRRERIVTAVADRKWNTLVAACSSGVRKDIDKACRDWIIIAYSTKAVGHIAAIKRSTEYQLLEVEREAVAQSAASDALDLATRRMQLDQQRMQLQAGQLRLQQQQAEFQKKMAEFLAAGAPAALVTDKTELTHVNGSKISMMYQHR